MNLILIAPPAAGKGTLANSLKEKYGFTTISAGDVCREEIKSGSELGNEMKAIVDSGLLIDNKLMQKLMHKKLSSLGKKDNIIFDGYPRAVEQVGHFKEICEDLGIEPPYGIYLEIDKDVALKRALGRQSCPKCGTGYNKYSEEFKPKVEGMCDICNVELTSRNDDNEESFSKRYNTYMTETEQVIKILDSEGRLVNFNSNRGSNTVLVEVEAFLKEKNAI